MFKIITIPFDLNDKGFDDELLNRFIINKHIKHSKAVFFQNGDAQYWSVFMAYDPLVEASPKSETAPLNESQRMLFERLKAWRKEKAEKEGVPVYIVGTNKEFMDLVTKAPKTLEALKSIRGFGKSKVSKYGSEITDIIKAFYEVS